MPIYDFMFEDRSGIVPELMDMRSDQEIANPVYSVQDYDSPDYAMVMKIAEETMNVSGADVLIHARTDNEDIDEDWDEDASPTYQNAEPIKGFFVPQPLEQELTKWGVDQVNAVEIVFLRNHVHAKWRDRSLRAGDIIEIPYNSTSNSTKPKYYSINNAQDTGNYRYQWLYVTCQCALITGDPNIRPAHDNAESPGD